MWCERYRPTCLEELEFHKDVKKILLNVIKERWNLPNCIFYGPTGSGKKTIIDALLTNIYGKRIERLSKSKNCEVSVRNSTTDIHLIENPYYVIYDCNYRLTHDFDILKFIINEYVGSSTLLIFSKKSIYKTIILYNVDKLSIKSQYLLKCYMKNYFVHCRFILHVEKIDKIINSIKNRCLSIRVPTPNRELIKTVTKNILNRENMEYNTRYNDIMEKEKDLNIVLSKIQFPNCEISWIVVLDQMIDDLMNIDKVKLKSIRYRYYNILINNISSNNIMLMFLKKMIDRLKNDLDKYKILNIINSIAKYNRRLVSSNRNILHLECMTVNVAQILNNI
jgi:replication factor C subunit 3/5